MQDVNLAYADKRREVARKLRLAKAPAPEQRIAAHRERMLKKRRGEAWSGQKEKRELKAVKKEKRLKRKDWIKKKAASGEGEGEGEGGEVVTRADGEREVDVEVESQPTTREDIDNGAQRRTPADPGTIQRHEAEAGITTDYNELRRENRTKRAEQAARVGNVVTGQFDGLC